MTRSSSPDRDLAMLSELRDIHLSERAPAALHARLLERHRASGGGARSPEVVRARWPFFGASGLQRSVRRAVLPLAASAAVWAAVHWPSPGDVHVSKEPSTSTRADGVASRTHVGPERQLDDGPAFSDPRCPQNLMPHGTAFAPRMTDSEVIRAGVTVHTFEQGTTSCGPITRRYLEYVPKATSTPTSAPVVLLLHGGPDRAEGMRSVQTQGRFETLANRDGFIVIYAAATPSADSNPEQLNEGRWHVNREGRHEVDDEEYLTRVLDDLGARGVTDGSNEIFLVGHTEGAIMALQAAAHRPDLYSGVAAFMPYGVSSQPPQPLPGARLSRAMFVLPMDAMRVFADEWALGLGVWEETVQNPVMTILPNQVVEGKTYTGGGPVALSTRNSTLTQIDLSAYGNEDRYEPRSPRVRILLTHGANFFIPMRNPRDTEQVINDFGFRNQDIDGVDEAWSFLSGAAVRR